MVFVRLFVCAESVATLPPFGPIEGQKWFDRISSQWESQKNRFALIYFGKIRFLPLCIWNLPFMSTASVVVTFLNTNTLSWLNPTRNIFISTFFTESKCIHDFFWNTVYIQPVDS